MKIYDCFIFFNELDIIGVRLNELNDVGNYFVLVEATTVSGKPKELYFQKNKDIYKKFENKIIYIITDIPQIK
jgi:beta-1,4-mannosyl-glycoprotein beta-1,4-N-acetylglucosaminyltransferase